MESTTQFLTFRLNKEIYAFDIFKVREVFYVKTITEIPQTPPFLKGVINLRGSVVSVIDMRSKFGMAPTELTEDTSIIILGLTIDDEPLLMGVMVDAVESVIDLAPDQITDPPQMGTHLKVEFITGMGIQDENFIIILNLERVFSMEELNLAHETPALAANLEETP